MIGNYSVVCVWCVCVCGVLVCVCVRVRFVCVCIHRNIPTTYSITTRTVTARTYLLRKSVTVYIFHKVLYELSAESLLYQKLMLVIHKHTFLSKNFLKDEVLR